MIDGDYARDAKVLRIFQHTPGTYPRPPTKSLWFGIPFMWWFGDSWGMLQGYVGVLLEKSLGVLGLQMVFGIFQIPAHVRLGGGFKHFLFSTLPGEMIQFDEHIFQMGLVQPPNSRVFWGRFFSWLPYTTLETPPGHSNL